MKKAVLRNLRTLNVTKEMSEKAKNNFETVKYKYCWEDKERTTTYEKYRTFARVQNLGGFIKIALFIPKEMRLGIKSPAYEIFINEEGGEYITRELNKDGKEVRWLKSIAYNLPRLESKNYHADKQKDLWVNEYGRKTLMELSKDAKDPFDAITKWQCGIRQKQIAEQERKEQAPWDALMKLVPEIPKSALVWMAKEVPTKNYIFYDTGDTKGTCTYCNKDVPITNPHHLFEDKCPVCKKSIVYIRRNARKYKIGTDDCWNTCNVIQKVEGGIVVRRFSVRKAYKPDYIPADRTESLVCDESERTFYFENGKGRIAEYDKKAFYYGLYKNKYHRWISRDRLKYSYYYHADYPRIDTGVKLWPGSRKALKGHGTSLDIMMDMKKGCDAVCFFNLEKESLLTEQLLKNGLLNLLHENSWKHQKRNLIDESKTELTKALMIDTARLKRLKAMNGSTTALRWLQKEKQVNTIWSDEMITFFQKNHIEYEHLNFVKPNEKGLVKIFNYIKKQSLLSGDTPSQTLNTWSDYLKMAADLKMQTDNERIWKPSDLKKAHGELIAIKESKSMDKTAKETEKKFPGVKDVLPTLEKYEYKDAHFEIKAPKCVKDIVREGTILKHCVHTCDYYFDRIQNRESYLLFLRKTESPDMPWYTLEVEPGGNIRQKRTTGDNQNKDLEQAVPFLKKWQKTVQKRISAEDKKLAKAADLKRKENYKQLRVNGNVIWHGKLQGKLLADVLEADLMTV